MAIVTTPGGERVEGRLVRRDDFIIVLADAEGLQRGFRRDGDVPKVEIRDPLEGHKKLLPGYTNKDIHNVTAAPGHPEMMIKRFVLAAVVVAADPRCSPGRGRGRRRSRRRCCSR